MGASALFYGRVLDPRSCFPSTKSGNWISTPNAGTIALTRGASPIYRLTIDKLKVTMQLLLFVVTTVPGNSLRILSPGTYFTDILSRISWGQYW